MDQNTILTGLKHALEKGNGSLDDLNELLKRAQADVEQVKKEQAEAARKAKEAETLKRGQVIAEMATRVLEGAPTAEDVAMVLGTYLKHEGLDVEITAESVIESVKNSKELDTHLEELGDAIAELFNTFAGAIRDNSNKPCEKKCMKNHKEDADAALDSFLHDLGLR